MNASTVVLIIATAGFCGTSFALWQRLHVEREQHMAVQKRLAQLEQRVHTPTPAISPRASAVPQAAAPQIEGQPQSPRRAPQLAALVNVPAAGGWQLIQRQRQMLEDPEYRAALRAQHRASMRQIYPDVATAMKLTADQVERLYDLLADQQLRAMQNSVGTEVDGAESQREWQRRIEEQQRQNEAELADVLGAQKAQAWKDYQMSLGARQQVRELRNLLADSSEPLRPDQVEPLVTALAQEDARFSEEVRAGFSQRQRPDRLSLMKQSIEAQLRYYERRRDAAAPYLSSVQIAHFDEMIERQTAMAKVQLKLAETQPEMDDGAVVIDSTGGPSKLPGFVPSPP